VHKLLARQLRAARRYDGSIDLDALIGIIDQAYDELDRERRLNDRAAKLMEEELLAANVQATREHSAVLGTILKNAPDGMLVIGANERI
jgi:two-component system sensor histidine kinase/response regulator